MESKGCKITETSSELNSKPCTRPSIDAPSSQRISWWWWGGIGWRQQGRYLKSKLQKTAYFIVAESLDVPPKHTHLHPIRCLDTPERFAWIAFSCLSFITRCQHSKSGRYRLTAGSKLIG